MIVYRGQTHDESAIELLADICARFRLIEDTARPTLESVQRLLIDFGVFESAVADALMKDVMTTSHEIRTMRSVAVALGRVFHRVVRGKHPGKYVDSVRRDLLELTSCPLPATVCVSVPEGYAYYGLFPEMYIEPAETLLRQRSLSRAVVIGIRSIGASLSAVVAGTLEELGCRVKSYTVRPSGHPFNRLLNMTRALQAEWRDERAIVFAIVDEGPGISGSSFASVADALTECGVPAHNVVFLPSWDADPGQFANGAAAQRWRKHARYVGGFHQPWLNGLREVSAGKWRGPVYDGDADSYPAVQPQHEARKYLADSRVLLKFAGLGGYGDWKLGMARQLAEHGFGPEVLGIANGFLAHGFVGGTPLRVHDSCPELLGRIAEYCAFRAQTFPAQRSTDFATLCQMIDTNMSEGGPSEVSRDFFKHVETLFDGRAATAVDGRMMPHEWLRTARGFLKTDSVDHHANHFYPGCADIAWDLAAVCVEFRLSDSQRSFFLERYSKASGDLVPNEIIGFYRLAYAAFRLGYTTLAAHATSETPDGDRFISLQTLYRRAAAAQFARQETLVSTC